MNNSRCDRLPEETHKGAKTLAVAVIIRDREIYPRASLESPWQVGGTTYIVDTLSASIVKGQRALPSL